MCQKKTITINNFCDFTFGVWEEVLFIPDESIGYELILESKDGSKYYKHKNSDSDEIFRVSDHWGGGIGTCNWYLNAYTVCNSYKFKEYYEGEIFVGFIKLSNLQRMIPYNIKWADENGYVDRNDNTIDDKDINLDY